MKQFYPTYLYIKTHNKTGLKYFGKTTRDPFSYRGSGLHWQRHLRKYGNDVTTEVFGYFEDRSACQEAALKFSFENNIAESLLWANIINENGTDGGATGRRNYSRHTVEARAKMSASRKGSIPWNTGLKGVTLGNKIPKTNEQKKKISKSLTGRKQSPETIEKRAKKLRGRTRPDIALRMKGFKHSADTRARMKVAQQNKGPLSEETKQKIREARKHQVITVETKKKLSGKVVVVDKHGVKLKIPKDIYYSQTGQKHNWEWVAHRSTEAKERLK